MRTVVSFFKRQFLKLKETKAVIMFLKLKETKVVMIFKNMKFKKTSKKKVALKKVGLIVVVMLASTITIVAICKGGQLETKRVDLVNNELSSESSDSSEEEVVINEEEEKIKTNEATKSYKEYVKAVQKSVFDNEDIKKNDADSKVEKKEISVMDVNSSFLKIKSKMSKEEYSLMERIVEAEAGGEDVKGMILVADVVCNRVKSDHFPNSVKGVIMQSNGRVAQFSPVSDGRLWSVKVSSKAKEATKRALNGEDYSMGALYFMQRSAAAPRASSWFDRSLTRLFRHGCHEFFK